MDSLIRYGFTIEEIKILMDTNEDISSTKDNDVSTIIKLLEDINCTNKEIKNIFICNPFCLTNNINKINKLIEKLIFLGFNNLNLLINANPYILNISDKELDKMYNNKKSEGLNRDEIIDYFTYNIIF